MADITDPATRSRMMSGIKGRDTKPELAVRRALHAAGLRYGLHDKALPGKPDLVFPKYKAVVLVHGCFWHQHAGCSNAKFPATRQEFWGPKLAGNVERDRKTMERLEAAGWRVCTVWECSVRKVEKARDVSLYERLNAWVRSSEQRIEL